MRCCFCSELKGHSDNEFSQIYSRGCPSSRLIAQTRTFVILPTLGQLTEGYLLIVTKKHYPSMGHLTTTQLCELEEVKQKISKILSSLYGKPIFFEHGPVTEGIGGCGVYHAHLHVAPIAETIDLIDNLRSLKGDKIKTLEPLIDKINRGKSYLFYENQEAVKYIFDGDGVPSQFFRRILAEKLGKINWDWRRSGREKELLSTLKKLGHLQSALT